MWKIHSNILEITRLAALGVEVRLGHRAGADELVAARFDRVVLATGVLPRRPEIPGLEQKVLAGTPAGRWGRIDDFAGIAVFLASAASDFLTGAAMPFDGGYSSLL